MRGYLPEFEAVSAKNLKDALKILNKEKGLIKPLAGGTDLMVLFAAGHLKGGKYLDIWGLKELKKIEMKKNYIEIGALVTYTDIRENAFLKKNFPNLCKAAAETGAIAIQNRGTIGGNIANASPAADTPPALLTYDAEIVLLSAHGERAMPYCLFHTAYKKMKMDADELIKCIRIPIRKKGWVDYYRKVGTRKAQAISKVCLSASFKRRKGGELEGVRIAFGSVAPVPLRCVKTEEYLVGKKPTAEVLDEAAKVLMREVSPIDDIRSTKNYRVTVAGNTLKHAIKESF